MRFHTLQAIRKEEGKSLLVYKDTLGHLTVGVGHKVLPEDNLRLGESITEAKSSALFLADLKKAQDGVEDLIPLTGSQLPIVEHVLTCMVFQMGVSGVLGFIRFLKALEHCNYALAAKEMLDSKWACEDSPERAQRLANELWTPRPKA